MTTKDQEITEDSLTASLHELTAVAGALGQLQKGGIVNSGHDDERGHVSGGVSAETGSIETLMIGKLVAGGMDAGSAGMIVGEMLGALTESGLLGKKSEEEEPDGDEGGEGKEEEMSAYARGYFDAISKQRAEKSATKDADLSKAIKDTFAEDGDIRKGFDASPFLEAFTDKMVDSLGVLAKSMEAVDSKHDKFNRTLAAAVVQIGTLMKSHSATMGELGARLGIVERTPQPQKGATNLPKAKALSKGFEGQKREEKLSKSQVAAALTYLNLEKGVREINGLRTGQQAAFAESGGVVGKDTYQYLENYLAQHPDERKAALEYR